MKTAAQVAQTLRTIPRKAITCKIYGTVRVGLDRPHARNLLKHLVPWATSADLHDALAILDDRLDAAAPQPGYRPD